MSLADAERLKRLDRWMERHRLNLEGLTWPGARLLDSRLAIRRRAGWVTAGMWVAAAICFVATPTATELPIRGLDAGAWWSAAVAVLVGGAVSVRSVLIRRGEQRLAADLPRRVTGDHAVSVWQRIGSIRLASAFVVFSGSLVMLIAIIASTARDSVITLYAVLPLR